MATDIFLVIDNVIGESQDADFKDQIECTEWTWTFTQVSTMNTGGGGGAGKVTIEGIEITKSMDYSTPFLAIRCCNGKHIPHARLVQRKPGGDDKPMQYLFIDMYTVMVSSIAHSSSGEVPTEKLKLNFARFSLKYIEQTDTGGKGEEKLVEYDIKKNLTVKA